MSANCGPPSISLQPDIGMRVLIADDQKDVGKSLAELVSLCNHQIVGVVGSGLEAIQAYSQHHPDVVLMDYRMPKLNGTTALRNILSKDPAARVILVTGWTLADEATASGAIAILLKPIDLQRLSATLQTVAQMLPVPAGAAPPTPKISSQPDSIDHCQPAAQPLPVVPPSLETTLPVDATTSHLQQTGEVVALDEEKISGKRRSSQRRAQWSERDERHDRQSRKATRSSAAGAAEIPRTRVH